jgi:hypothetical protein
MSLFAGYLVPDLRDYWQTWKFRETWLDSV